MMRIKVYKNKQNNYVIVLGELCPNMIRIYVHPSLVERDGDMLFISTPKKGVEVQKDRKGVYHLLPGNKNLFFLYSYGRKGRVKIFPPTVEGEVILVDNKFQIECLVCTEADEVVFKVKENSWEREVTLSLE